MIRGTLKADGLAVGRITIDFMKTTPSMEANVAVINENLNQPMSWSKSSDIWSPETLEALRRLRDCVEKDFGRLMFVDGGTTSDAPKGVNMGGIGEHLSSDTRQV